jgi:hypothetical protein
MSKRATIHNKRDANEEEIKLALAQIGIATFEAGPLDFWMYVKFWIPVEVKTPEGRLTDGQQAFVDLCEDRGWPYRIFRSALEAVASVQALRE